MADAFRAVDQHGLSPDNTKHILLRAGCDTTAAPDAGKRINVGVHHRRRLEAGDLQFCQTALCRLLSALRAKRIRNYHCSDQSNRDKCCEKRFRHIFYASKMDFARAPMVRRPTSTRMRSLRQYAQKE